MIFTGRGKIVKISFLLAKQKRIVTEAPNEYRKRVEKLENQRTDFQAFQCDEERNEPGRRKTFNNRVPFTDLRFKNV